MVGAAPAFALALYSAERGVGVFGWWGVVVSQAEYYSGGHCLEAESVNLSFQWGIIFITCYT